MTQRVRNRKVNFHYFNNIYPAIRIELLANSSSRSFYEGRGFRIFNGFRKSMLIRPIDVLIFSFIQLLSSIRIIIFNLHTLLTRSAVKRVGCLRDAT